MATTTVATATETIYAKALTAMMVDAVYGAAVVDQLVRQESLVGKPTNTASFELWPTVGEPAPSVVALTVLGAGLAACALLALLSTEGDVCPSGYVVDGLMGDGFETHPTDPDPTCRCRERIGAGDTKLPPVLTGS